MKDGPAHALKNRNQSGVRRQQKIDPQAAVRRDRSVNAGADTTRLARESSPRPMVMLALPRACLVELTRISIPIPGRIRSALRISHRKP
jgi:hypothetical protein